MQEPVLRLFTLSLLIRASVTYICNINLFNIYYKYLPDLFLVSFNYIPIGILRVAKF